MNDMNNIDNINNNTNDGNNIDNINNNLIIINNNIEILNNNIKLLSNKFISLENKVDTLNNKVNSEVLEECKKMGSHIDFVENVYENVKHPLGYITNKIKYLTSSNNLNQYTLTNIKE